MKLNKKATSDKILKHVQNTHGMIIDIAGFKERITTVKDLKEACGFCGIDPVYH